MHPQPLPTMQYHTALAVQHKWAPTGSTGTIIDRMWSPLTYRCTPPHALDG
eukprot:gene2851-4537_t